MEALGNLFSLMGDTQTAVVMDLEWNQNIYRTNQRMPHEIIEIGACRIDREGKIRDRFSRIIRPQLYKKVDSHIREVTGITEKELSEGESFSEVYGQFEDWAGNVPLITWGRDDYPVLKRNVLFHNSKMVFTPPLNVQMIYGLVRMHDANRQMNLHGALEKEEIIPEIPAHRAVYDSECTVMLLPLISGLIAELDEEQRRNLLREIDKENRIADSSLKSVRTRHTLHTDAMMDDGLMFIRCPVCGARTRMDVPWFNSGRDRYDAIFICSRDGWIKGQMHFKRDTSGVLVMHQRTYPANKEEVDKVREEYKLYKLIPPDKRHHRLCMDEVRRKGPF